MKNKISRIVTMIVMICVGVALGSADVHATGDGVTTPTPGSVYNNTVSGKKEYCPNASEFDVRFDTDAAVVTDFNIACTEEYDAVMLPGVFIKDGTNYTATYDGIAFRKISEKGKGVVVQNGAVVTALEDNLNIDYIRFDNGSSLKDYAHAFRGWTKLTTVEGFLDAIEPSMAGSIDLGNTFNGCSSLRSITLDFKNRNATLYNTFSQCNALKTVVIKNANISRVEELAVHDATAYSSTTGILTSPMNITFENITFPENNTGAYLAKAFSTVSGKITFTNCKAGESDLLNFDRAFDGSKVIKVNRTLVPQYNKNCADSSNSFSNANIEVSGASAYSANYMFSESAYGMITLNNLIVEDTTSATCMFANADMVSVRGIDSWKVGAANLYQLFENATTLYDSESTAEQTHYLETEILADIKKVDLSKVSNANEMMCFDDAGYISDYRGLNLTNAGEFVPVSESVPFYTPTNAPQYYKLPYDTVYYQTEDDKTQCGGYRLTKISGSRSTIEGNKLQPDSLMVGDAVEIRIINILSGDASTYNVIGGHQLQDYLEEGVEYFSDSDCRTPAVGTTMVNDGNNVTVYCKDDHIEKDVDSDITFNFNTSTGNLNANIEGRSDQVKLIDYNPTLRIKKETDPESYTLTEAAKKKANIMFYDIGITVMEGGTEKQVKRISREMTITVPLPADYDGKGILALHYDKGLDKAPTQLTCSVDADAGTVSFLMNSFSHVALLYNDAEVEHKNITVKWIDDGNYRNRSGIDFEWTATYEGGLTTTGTLSYTVESESETKLPFDVSKVISGKALTGVTATYTVRSTIAHQDTWDAENLTLTMEIEDSTEKESHVVKIDFTDVEDKDFRDFISSDKNVTLTIRSEYEDGSFNEEDVTKMLATNFKTYEMPFDLVTVQANGTKLKTVTYKINAPAEYEVLIDYDADKITVTTEKDIFEDYVDYTVTGFFNDEDNAAGKRPDEVKVKVTAKFGEKEWTTNCSIVCRRTGYTGYSTHFEVPGSCNGVPRDDLTFEPDPVEDYKITVSKVEADHAWIDFDYEGQDPAPATFKRNVTVTFMNDAEVNRPKSISLNLQDSKGGNQIVRVITPAVGMGITQVEIDVPTDDTYTITKADGFPANYTLSYNGLNVVAVWNSADDGPPQPEKKYTQNFTVDINDKENEDGSRPEKITVTVSDGKGTEEKFDFDIKSGKRFTKSIQVADETAWSITKIEGLPERFKITLSANTATIDYTPEKVTKTVSVKWTDDGDNKDETRPTSVTIHVNNGSTLITNANVDANTNWATNVEVNKYVNGVEAKYTIDCDDVKNYSKTIGENEITFKFTGTLTKEAQKVEDEKKNIQANDLNAKTAGADASSTEEKEEINLSLESFDWIDYANRYPDLKRAYGYNKQKLYAHYIRYGIAEGRYATFTSKYSTVNEDILAAYFPDDYKYALIETSTNGVKTDTTITTETNESTEVESLSGNSVSGNSIEVAPPVEGEEVKSESGDDSVVKNVDGTTTQKMTSEDGTVTEITKDADGNIISTKQYKTGDARSLAANMSILFGALLLLAGASIGVFTLRVKRPR